MKKNKSSSRMRIAILNVTNSYVRGGIENKMWQLAHHLQRMGHELTVHMGLGPLRDPLNTPGLGQRNYPFIHRRFVPIGGRRFKKAVERLSMYPWVAGPLFFGRYDAMVINKPYDLPIALALRKLRGTKVCFISGGGEDVPGFGKMASACDGLVCPSQQEADVVLQKYGITAVVNRLGVDTDIFQPREWDEAMAERCGVQRGDIVLTTTGRLSYQKGHAVVLHALAELRLTLDDPSRLRYIVVGGGPEQPTLDKIVDELNLRDTVCFLGAQSQHEVSRVYSLTTLGLFLSTYESLGIAVGEAMACGVASIGSRVGGIPEQIVEGAGLLVDDYENPAAVAAAIRGALSDPDSREAWARRGREHILQEFSWERYARVIEQILRQDDDAASSDSAPTTS